MSQRAFCRRNVYVSHSWVSLFSLERNSVQQTDKRRLRASNKNHILLQSSIRVRSPTFSLVTNIFVDSIVEVVGIQVTN